MRMLQVVAMLLAGFSAAAASLAEEPLGRLFFSPAQRSTLDAGKYLATPAPVVPAARTVHLTGVVTRSDAESTVWINGRAYHDASPDGMQVKTDRTAPASTVVRDSSKAATARVKVGQRLDLTSGRTQEDFARRPAAVTVAPPAESPASPPTAAKKSKTSEQTVPLIREAEKSEKKDEGAAGNIGAEAPASAR